MLTKAFEFPSTYFNVKDTLECGQIFRYKILSQNRYAVYSLDKYAEVEQDGDKVCVYTTEKDYFWHFFDLDTNYEQKVQQISALSPVMKQACEHGKGIRILNQDLVEMIFCFIISANNNIKRIQAIIEKICNGLGADTPYGKAFPTVDAIANSSAEFFKSCGAGYRDKYLVDTAKMLQNFNLQSLTSLDSKSARKHLLTLQGVGPKVADCILLFGMHRGDVFPVDTWLKKAYHQFFEQGHRDDQISDYFCSLFGDNSGLCQQYLFYFLRNM